MPEIGFESRAQADAMIARSTSKLMGFRRKMRPTLPKNPSATIYIYNISDQPYEWTQAGFPRFAVDACPAGKEYSEPVILDGENGSGVYIEEVKKVDETEFFLYNTNEIAFAICMAGPGMPPTIDRRRKGLFMSRTNPPAADEIARAKSLLTVDSQRLLKEGDNYHAHKQPMEISDEHVRAARYLGQEREWAKPQVLNMVCPGCGGNAPATAAVHSGPNGCGWVLNAEAYEKNQALKKDHKKAEKTAA